jgi:hypothetical protein
MWTRGGTIAGPVPLCAAHLPTSGSVFARAGRGKKAFEEKPERRNLRLKESKVVGDALLRSVGNSNPSREVAEESLALSEGVEEVEVSNVVFHWIGRGVAGNLLS